MKEIQAIIRPHRLEVSKAVPELFRGLPYCFKPLSGSAGALLGPEKDGRWCSRDILSSSQSAWPI